MRIKCDGHKTLKCEFIDKIKTAAMELYQKTGIKCTDLSFTWLESEIPRKDRAVEGEFELEIKSVNTKFI